MTEKKDVCADIEKSQKKKLVGKWLKARKNQNKKEIKNEIGNAGSKRTSGNVITHTD